LQAIAVIIMSATKYSYNINIIFFGTYKKKTTPRVQVMIEGLTAQGQTVHECNIPLNFSTAERVKVLKQPWRLPALLIKLSVCWIRLSRLKRRLPSPDVVIVGYLGQFDIHLARWLYRKKTIALDYLVSGKLTAQDRQLSSGWKNKLLAAIDKSALKTANIIIVDTEESQQKLDSNQQPKSVVVLVGAPNNWFVAGSETKHQTGDLIKIIFFGNYIPLQGAPVIGRALAMLTQETLITMVGNGQELSETKQALATYNKSHIKWLNWVEADDLAELVAAQDICLGIFGTGSKAESVVPNKVYQGAAAGCVIITSNTPPQRRIFQETALFVQAGNSESLASCIDELIKDPTRLAQLKLVARIQALKTFTPKKVVEPLLEKISFNI
jgi:glycosyltransferase involved in cell wall biosynthesis